MFTMEVSDLIANVFTQFARGTEKCLAFSFDIHVADYDGGEQRISRKSIHFVLYGPSRSGSVRTFCAKSDDCFMRVENIPLYQWDNISNHDSCWVDAIRDKVSSEYFSMCKEVNEQREKDGLKKKAPVVMDTSAHSTLFRNICSEVKVEFKKKYGDRFGNRWNIASLDKAGIGK